MPQGKRKFFIGVNLCHLWTIICFLLFSKYQRKTTEICGFQQNTVVDLIKTKELLGLEEVLVESRGRNEPVKYFNEIQEHTRRLKEKYLDWPNPKIANQATKDLGMEISRNAVTRIRVKSAPPKPKRPSKQELLDMAKVAEETARKHSVEHQLKPIRIQSILLWSTESLLVVIIDGIDKTKYRKVADKLCRKLNEKEITLVGRLKVKLSFHLNKIRNKKFVQ